jgi:hypothetical protein
VQVEAGLRDDGARTFVEAVGLARLQGGQTLGSIADAQRRAGFIEEAAATFEEALKVTLSGDDKGKISLASLLVHLIVDNDRGKVVAASPTLRIRLVEAAEAIAESGIWLGQKRVDPLWPPRAQAAVILSAIAGALPN